MFKILNGDCLEQLDKLQDNSIGSIVTDPPYRTCKHNKKIWGGREQAGEVRKRWLISEIKQRLYG